MKKLINNPYANFYLNSAQKLGLEYEIVNAKVGLVRISNGSKILDISSNVVGVNSEISSKLSINKVKTSTLLQSVGIPVPAFKTFETAKSAVIYGMQQLKRNKSIVIKPINGSLSIGITVCPSNLSELKKAVAEAFEGNSSIMIEEYIAGRHFRITVLDEEIIAITERIPANIMGDGKSTIQELINQKNILRKKRKLLPIFLRKKDLNYLKTQNITLSKILPESVTLNLQLGCDLDIGGERVRVDRNSIPQENKDLFIAAVKALKLRFAGIDYITPDIMTPYTQITTAINEINSAPDPDVHYRDSYPHNNYAAERILEKIFSVEPVITKKSRFSTYTLPLPVSRYLFNR